MNLQNEFERILKKYKIESLQPTLQEKIERKIKKFVKKYTGCRFAIVGAGEQGKELFQLIRDDVNVVCFVDDEGECIESIPVLSYECMKKNANKIDVCIFASVLFHKRDSEKISILNPEVKLLDFYDAFDREGMMIRRSFYQYKRGCYENIIFHRLRYENEKENNLKDCYLEHLIYEFLYIKDFVNTFKYIDEYTKGKYKHADKYLMLKKDLLAMLHKVKIEMQKRKGKDFFWFWDDQVEYNELQMMPYLTEMIPNSLFFEKAYTMAPSTAPAMRGIFCGVRRIDNYDVFYEKTSLENSKLLQMLNHKGYEFCYCGDNSIQRTFDDSLCKRGDAVEGWCSSTIRIWEGLCKCLESDKPILVLVHILIETHASYMSPFLDKYYFARPYDLDGNDIVLIRNQIKKSLQYIDEQQKFYCELLGKKTTKLFMSDHGKILETKEKVYENKMHNVILMVLGEKIEPSRYKKVFSFSNLYKLIMLCIEDRAEMLSQVCDDDVALVQDVDIYNKILVERLIENKIKRQGWGFRAIYGQSDKYVRFRTGEEHYYILPDEDTDLIGEKKYEKRIEYLREKNGSFFIDIENEKKFEYARKLYE